MIRPLRQRHRLMVCTLGVLLPVAFSVGLAARKVVPVAKTVPPGLAGWTNGLSGVAWTKPDLWAGQRITIRLRRDAAGSVTVELISPDIIKPDVLVYWAAGKETVIEGLPENARLLGALSNRTPLPVSAAARREAGRFVLYSLAEHAVVGVSKSFIMETD